MYDINRLKTPEECRTVMQRAHEQGLEDIYNKVFVRLCEIEGSRHDDPADPLVKDFYATLAAYEQLLTEKNGRRTSASRTRQKIRNKGVHQSLVEWTRGAVETNGFRLLVDRGLPEYTAEYIVARHADRFPEDIVELANQRLNSHGIHPPR